MNNLSIAKVVGKGYANGWFTNCHCRYRCFKGARNTKKSYVIIGLEVIMKILSDPRRNILILRQTNKSNRFSTFSTLQMLIEQPDYNDPTISLRDYFTINKTTMTITYKPTGQMIIFGGMDDPSKITSTRMPVGYLTDVYFEEAFEIKDFEGIRKVDGTIRGKLPDGLFHQITFVFNAWNIDHWLYTEFFKGRLEDDVNYLATHQYQDFKDENLVLWYGKGLYLHTSTYKINEFRDKENYDEAMDELRKVAPEIWKVEALGMWGNATEATYPEFNDSLIRPCQDINNRQYYAYAIGIDTGLSNGEGKIKTGKDVRIRSATTMQLVGITNDFNTLCCIDEYFYSNEQQLVKKTEPELEQEIINKLCEWMDTYRNHNVLMQNTVLVYVDCADVGFRQGLELLARQQGLYNLVFQPSTKIRIQTRVDFIRLIMAFGEFIISDKCENLIREIKHSRRGENGRPREDLDDHAINANEYAWQPIIRYIKRWSSYKQH